MRRWLIAAAVLALAIPASCANPVVSWNTADTAATLDDLQYVGAKTVTTTMTVRLETTDSESAELAANYKC